MSQRLIISTATELVSVYPEDILYFEASGTYTTMHLLNKMSLTFSFNLAQMQALIEKQLKDSTSLMRVGKSLIINLDYIYHIQPAKQVLELAVPRLNIKVSLSASKEVLKTLKKFFEDEDSTR